MKRTLLALAVPALLAANVANADIEFWNQDGNIVSIYGRVNAENIISKHGNGNGDASDGRIGFTGVTQLSNELTGYARAEFQTNAAGAQHHELRYAYAGLNYGELGSFDYGRNDGISKMATSYTDVLPEFGGDAGNMVLLGDRETAVATYRNQDFYGLVDGLNFAIQYADRNASDTKKVENDDVGYGYYSRGDRSAFGVAVEYVNILDSYFSLSGAYAVTSKAYDTQINLGDDDDENRRSQSWVAAAKFEYGNLYVAALYNYSKNVVAGIQIPTDNTTVSDDIVAKSVKGYEMVVAYGVDLEVGRVTPSVAYIQDKAKRYGDDESQTLAKYVNLGLEYEFNKNFSALVDYKINMLKTDDGIANKYTKDSVALALIYQF